MSDTQLDSSNWGNPANQTSLAAADEALVIARRRLWELQAAVEEAQDAVLLAEGRVWLERERPTWKEILSPQVPTALSQLYTYCMQLGFKYAVFNDCIYRAGTPGEGMMNTGAKIEDIK